jgi:hypothetical protein
MGQMRATTFRFHLDRDVDFVQHAVMKKRLLAGLSPPRARQLTSSSRKKASRRLPTSSSASSETRGRARSAATAIPSGARVGAILQALIAREPVERRPTIRGWLPPGFVPPQVTIVSAKPEYRPQAGRNVALAIPDSWRRRNWARHGAKARVQDDASEVARPLRLSRGFSG